VDEHTLAVCNLLLLFLYAATIFMYRTMYRDIQPGVRGCDWFILSNVLLALPSLDLLFPVVKPSRSEIFFGMLLSLLGHLPLHRAFAELLSQKRELWWAQLVVAAVGMAILLSCFFMPRFTATNSVISLVYGVQYGLTGLMLFRVAEGEGREAGWFAGTVSTAFAIWHFIRYAVTIALKESGWDGGRLSPAIRLAAHGGLALAFLLISISRLQIQMQRETQLDELTGLMNLRAVRRVAAEMIARGRRRKMALPVLMIDLDGFKDANDRFGHEAGDAMLRAVARALLFGLREDDKVARLGGDEFCMLLPGIDEWEAVGIAERCRVALEEMVVPYDGDRMQISACFGVAHSPDCAMSWEELLHCGDVAMYQAKHQGRNRVALAGKSTPPVELRSREIRAAEVLR
jgi:diguanylate cyclase (GGDEF)-like protein